MFVLFTEWQSRKGGGGGDMAQCPPKYVPGEERILLINTSNYAYQDQSESEET